MRFCKPSVTATFTLEYKTSFGEEIRVVGNVPELGEWDPEKAASMKWTDGHVWEIVLPLVIPDEPLEYKYVLMHQGNIKCWEPVGNRVHHSQQLFGSSTLSCHNVWGQLEAVDRLPASAPTDKIETGDKQTSIEAATGDKQTNIEAASGA